MMQGMYTATTGMKTHTAGLGIISQNLANVGTVGYKQQSMLFENLMSKDIATGVSASENISQVGYGSNLSQIRTLFTGGSFQPSGNMTDIAISGKGFFQVSDDMDLFYTRAGNFTFDKEGVLRSPGGLSVSGAKITDGVEADVLTEIRIDMNDDQIMKSKVKPTTKIDAIFNVFDKEDSVTGIPDPANPGTYLDPYFALASAWDGAAEPNLPDGTKKVDVPFYDSKGTSQYATIHFDKAPSSNGEQILEYIVTIDPSLDGSASAGTKGAGLLMAGTLRFNPAGQLVNMSAFSAPEGDKSDLNRWVLADLQDGVAQVKIPLEGQGVQNIALNFGVKGGAGWDKNTTAAGVGSDMSQIPGMEEASFDSVRSTALNGGTAIKNISQDGYAAGEFTGMYIDDEGKINVRYSNGQEDPVYRIPIFRFVSEDGLRREGGNLYSQTADAGEMAHGVAGTENYGSVLGSHIETSNVNTASEMVNMIIIQRGFQSNSKAFDTVNQMIKGAMEIKRS